LGSTAAILSRGFCDANIVSDPTEIEEIFSEGVRNIRAKEREVAAYTEEQYAQNRAVIREKVAAIVETIKAKRKSEKA
ncbi:MAG: aldolase, partial [Clostridia bacterium]|nr:aldolase [Clostridia bacterium]